MTSTENAERNEKPFDITDACHALAQDDYILRHSQVANIVHKELVIKCGLSKEPPIPYYKYEPHYVLENSNYKLCYDRYIILTPWCRVLLEQLTGLQLVKKFPAFHGTRRFITALTSVRHLSLSITD